VSDKKKVAFVSLGCAKNLVDSEKMLGQLAEAGCLLTNDADDADVIVINTCGFLEAARAEAHEVIADLVALKHKENCKRIVVAGCLVQRDREKLLGDVPGIDALVGGNNRGDIVDAVLARSTAEKKNRKAPDLYLGDYHPHTLIETGRLRLTPRHYAYLRISEGCDQKCTFCTIPSIRGPMHSKPVQRILGEARELIADGAVELILIGQDTTSYGQDIGYAPGLAGLLGEIDKLDGLLWARLMYAYPSIFTDEMIDAIARLPKIATYIDIPLQHINDRILKAMHRCVTRSQTEALLQKLRDGIPGVAIRTTLIAGFPGETEAEHQELVDFICNFRFDALGVFGFSPEPDTPAGKMKDQIPEPIKQQRIEELMLAQQQVAFQRNAECVNATFDVLIDGVAADGLTPARTQGQAPEVDAATLVRDAPDAPPGTVLTVRCTGHRDYDLLATPSNRPLPVVDPVQRLASAFGGQPRPSGRG